MTATPPHAPKHILVIDDDPSILQLFDELLGEEGYRVSLDNVARETVAIHHAVRDHQPDLVILDFVLGDEGGGWQVLEALEMDQRTRDIPVIICTGAVRQVTEMGPQLEERGVKVVLKPFDIDELLSVVEEIWKPA